MDRSAPIPKSAGSARRDGIKRCTKADGSDVAALTPRAEDRGDYFVVNGQKVWTTLGHRAQYCMLLARTDPAAPKHKGLSYMLVDMKSPGITVRPLIQMTGNSDFNEI